MISKEDLMSLSRALAVTVGAELVRRGLTSDAVVEAAAGAVTIIAGIAWMWLKNRAAKKKLAAAEAKLPPGAVMKDSVPTADAGVTWCGPCK